MVPSTNYTQVILELNHPYLTFFSLYITFLNPYLEMHTFLRVSSLIHKLEISKYYILRCRMCLVLTINRKIFTLTHRMTEKHQSTHAQRLKKIFSVYISVRFTMGFLERISVVTQFVDYVFSYQPGKCLTPLGSVKHATCTNNIMPIRFRPGSSNVARKHTLSYFEYESAMSTRFQ